MWLRTGSMAIMTPYFSAISSTGSRFHMKVRSASREWVLASNLYAAFGAPVSVPTMPMPARAATRRLPK